MLNIIIRFANSILYRFNFHKMTSSAFLIGVLFCLHFVSYPCMGKIFLPPGGNTMVVAPGTDVELAWSFDAKIAHVRLRWWRFFPNFDLLATIFNDKCVKIQNSTLPGVEIRKPATLILKNVDLRYNGTYRFFITSEPRKNETCRKETSDVVVSVAVKPTVTTNCSNPTALNEGDDIECLCKEEGGNPPANLSWTRDGVRIGYTGYRESLLTLRNISKTARGTYKCVAQSHNLRDEISIEIIIHFPPAVTRIVLIPERAVHGKPLVILCDALAVPVPSYIIIHNDTEVVSTDKTYIIKVLDYSHAGSYKCFATNKLGNSSKAYNFSVLGKAICNKPSRATEWYIFLILVVSGVIIGVFLSYIVVCSRRWLKNRKPQSNPEPQPSNDDTVYQGLDLTQMNSGDNYQSLRVNSGGDDVAYENDHNYTELNDNRDVEHNYQSLI